jgi:hypothetical protein
VSDNVGWRFPPQNGGVEQGFNDPAIDHFKGERVSALVRETIQNALDARDAADEPVTVRFTLDELTDLHSTGFVDLRQYLDEGLEIERLHDHADNVAFYEQALRQVGDGVVKVLGIHDYNTSGLTGPTENPPGHPAVGAWLALVKGAGVTHKSSAGALGSYGHGSRAPFAMSELRTVFYLSRNGTPQGMETRFQGKSILQSIPLNRITGENQWSQSTGYYGSYDEAECRPLVDDDVPEWATRFRRLNPGTNSMGTSVYVPEPYEVDDEREFWAQVRVAVVANFYYAVLVGHLVVLVGDEVRIDSTTAESTFDEVMSDLDRLNPNDKVRERLKSALTVRHPEFTDERDLDGVGVVRFFIRFSDTQERRVGIARGNGMLITRRPEMLRRFDGPLKHFDLFVCVSSEEGSALLRSLENPAHDAFDFDRINDKAKRAEARDRYSKFAKAIKDLVGELATIDMTDEQVLTELDEFFQPDSGKDSAGEDGERGRGMKISLAGKRRPRHVGGRGGTDSGGGEGGGNAGGDRTRKQRGGDIPKRGTGSGSSGDGVPVRNLRVVRDGDSDSVAVVTFTTPGAERGSLVLLRSGERNVERLRFRLDGEDWRTDLPLEGMAVNSRRRVRVEFEDPRSLEFAIEGRLAE